MFKRNKKTASKSGPAQEAKKGLHMTRIFHAPPELLFDIFTQGEHMPNWWGPRGFKTTVISQSLQPGGSIHYMQEAPNGGIMWGKFNYREIEAPHKFVYTNSFADAEGNRIRAPFSKDWPLEILNTITFEPHENGTKLVLHGLPEDAKKGERRVFEALMDNVRQGMNGTFELLDEYLEQVQKKE
ncbi:SRPBCC domain-containing protein [Paenibacillus sp. J5C_2022]|uniref:SRPBCC family protein n=1 Tax=Paenibacillus sp. J5C2022 TaxID=2977129 RepID=UPI0021D080C9|nr:SRPBCC domain-containing protein [Paenibacillus sp. J5C2022]MCU6707998.1 SRPBCC domain-containing protein [Paenibacillus sp. J5C2022]